MGVKRKSSRDPAVGRIELETMVPAQGFEPWTIGLKDRCSNQAELRRRRYEFRLSAAQGASWRRFQRTNYAPLAPKVRNSSIDRDRWSQRCGIGKHQGDPPL